MSNSTSTKASAGKYFKYAIGENHKLSYKKAQTMNPPEQDRKDGLNMVVSEKKRGLI